MTNPAPQLPPATRPALQRSSTDRMLGGVCGGLAAYSGLDPVLWRVGMVALTLLGPGVVVYLLLWPVAGGHGIGWLYTAAAVGLGGWFALEAHRLLGRIRRGDEARPMKLFHASISYMALLSAAIVLDVLV